MRNEKWVQLLTKSSLLNINWHSIWHLVFSSSGTLLTKFNFTQHSCKLYVYVCFCGKFWLFYRILNQRNLSSSLVKSNILAQLTSCYSTMVCSLNDVLVFFFTYRQFGNFLKMSLIAIFTNPSVRMILLLLSHGAYATFIGEGQLNFYVSRDNVCLMSFLFKKNMISYSSAIAADSILCLCSMYNMQIECNTGKEVILL